KEVLAYFANLHGVADPAPAIAAGLERFRIPHLAEAMSGELSSGQRTLVGIIKATLHRPQLLAGLMIVSAARLVAGLGAVALSAWLLFSFNVTSAGWGLIPVIAVLMLV